MPVEEQTQSRSEIGSANARLREVLLAPDVHGATLLMWVVENYATVVEEQGKRSVKLDCLYWHDETLEAELEQDLGAPIPDFVIDRLMAAIAVQTTDWFFKDVHRFQILAAVLAGEPYTPQHLAIPDVADCAWAIAEALIIHPPNNDEEANTYFCDEIRHYVGAMLKEEGFVTAPDLLRIALGADFREEVAANFSGDPELTSSIWKVQQDRTEDVRSVLLSGLESLLAQLKALPLRRGDVKTMEERILAITQQSKLVKS